MGYLQDFFIAIAILYLIECVLAVRRDLIVFWSLGFGKSRVTRADNLPGSPTRGLFLAMPLPPLGRVFLAQFWPLSISPAGVANCRPHTLGVDIVQEPPPEFAGFDDMHQLDHDDEYIRINGRRFARAVDSAAAQDFVSIIGRVKQTPADRRQQVIEAAIAESLDAEAVRTELSRFDACSASVRLSCNALLVHLFVVCPLVARQLGLSGTWLYLSVAILVLWITAIICYYLAHRALCPAHAAERRRQAVIVALTPLAAIRAIDALSRQRLARFHPLAIAAVLCGRSAFRDFALQALCDLEYPRAIGGSIGDQDAAAAVAWFRAGLRSYCASLVASTGIDPAEMLAVPAADDEHSQAYCPRCRGQFVHIEKTCPYCAGVPLRTFGGGDKIEGSAT